MALEPREKRVYGPEELTGHARQMASVAREIIAKQPFIRKNATEMLSVFLAMQWAMFMSNPAIAGESNSRKLAYAVSGLVGSLAPLGMKEWIRKKANREILRSKKILADSEANSELIESIEKGTHKLVFDFNKGHVHLIPRSQAPAALRAIVANALKRIRKK